MRSGEPAEPKAERQDSQSPKATRIEGSRESKRLNTEVFLRSGEPVEPKAEPKAILEGYVGIESEMGCVVDVFGVRGEGRAIVEALQQLLAACHAEVYAMETSRPAPLNRAFACSRSKFLEPNTSIRLSAAQDLEGSHPADLRRDLRDLRLAT